MTAGRVATIIDNERQVHMAGGFSDYSTACGIDMDDPTIGHFPENVSSTHDLIDCPACIRIWQDSRRYRRADFKGA